MPILIDMEIFMVFFTAIFFTLCYFIFGEKRNTKIVLGTLTSLVWFVLGLTYVMAQPEFPSVSLLFFGIGLILVIATIWDALQLIKLEKEMG